MFRTIRLILLLGLLIISAIATQVQAASSSIYVLRIEGTINPVLIDYIERGIDQAEENNATALIIQLDTPGGLDTAMRDIIKEIVNAKIPVVVYVSPSGARAASAGVFITMSAHVAVMATNTSIGAASPVAMGAEGEQQMSETMKDKVVNDAAAYIRSLAEAQGRNMEWAEKAVREAVSATEREALELNVIDMVAPNLEALISQLDGREVTLLDGSVVTLKTQNATIRYVDMTTIEDFLYTIADPNIAYILMMLPVNYAGVLLMVLAFGLFRAEVFTATFGLFTAGGVTALVIGSLILFKEGGPLFQVNPWLIATVTIFIGGFFAFIVNRVIHAHRHQATTGWEELIGKKAVVKVALEPEGTVLLRGERWTAISESGPVKPGEEVIITEVDGLTLKVTKEVNQ